jgi:hypothetical protein
VKQPLLAYGADTLKHLREGFVATNFNMRKLLTEVVKVSALRGFEKTSSSGVSLLQKPKPDTRELDQAKAGQP